MGSSIRGYLRLCCGVFHQIPTLTGVLTSSGEGYKGSEGVMLCLHWYCLFVLSASLGTHVCSVSLQTAMGTCVCLLSVCERFFAHLDLSLYFCFTMCLFLHVQVSSCMACMFTHTYITYMHNYHVTLCVRVTVGDLVAKAARGGRLMLSHGRGASFSPAYRKQTS